MNQPRFFLSCEIPTLEDVTISRMTATFNGLSQDQYDVLADLVFDVNSEDISLWACVVTGELKKMATALGPFSSQSLTIYPELQAAKTTTTIGIATILREWECEELAMFWADHESAIRVLAAVKGNESKWWQYARNQRRSPLLRCLNEVEPIMFFSLGHQSLDIFGSSVKIAAFFAKSMEQSLETGQENRS